MTISLFPHKQRQMLVALLITLALLSSPLVFGSSVHALSNPIVIENQNPGTAAWQYWNDPAISALANDVSKQIKGYASATSVNKGGSIDFYVSVNPAPQTFDIKIYRIGYYGGLGGRLMQTITGLPATTQSVCPTNATTGLIECHWNRSYTLTVPTNWTSGVYLATLINQNKYANYIIFVVRDDARSADLLYQMSVTTYQAYNRYPNDNLTGKSLYDESYGANTISGTKRAVKVSFDRPYMDAGAGQFMSWERYFIKWVERMGYDVAYSTDVDTHTSGARLRNYKGFLSVGHDEYWSKQMYDAVEVARSAGVSLGFFGANDDFWQVRFEDSSSGIPNRTMVCYKDASIDPVQGPTTTVNWRHPMLNRPEQRLVGIQYGGVIQGGNTVSAHASFVVKNSNHWIYAGTGVTDGASIPGIVGYEVDKYYPDVPPPIYSNDSYILLAESPYTTSGGRSDVANTSIYQAPSGAWVFAAGTIAWSWGLENYEVVRADPRIQKMTANILNAFIGNSSASPTATRTPTRTASPVASSTRTPTSSVANVQVSPTATRTVSPVASSTRTPTSSVGSVQVSPTTTRTMSPTVSPTRTPTAMIGSPSPSRTPTRTASPIASPTRTPTTAISSPSPSRTPTRTVSPTVSPTRTPTAMIGSPSPSRTPTRTMSPTGSPTRTPTTMIASPSPSRTPTRTVSPAASPTRTPTTSISSPSPSRTPTRTPSPSASATRTPTAAISITPPSSTATRTPSPSASATRTPTATISSTPPLSTATRTLSPTASPTRTPPATVISPSSPTATQTPTRTVSPTASATRTPTRTVSPTVSPTDSPTQTMSPTASPTRTPTATLTPTRTVFPTVSPTDSPIATLTPTRTMSPTASPTRTPTATLTPTWTMSPSASPTDSPIATLTPTQTISPTASLTDSPTLTLSPTQTMSPSASPTDSPTAALTPTQTMSPIASSTDTPIATVSSTPPASTDTLTPTLLVSPLPSPTDTAPATIDMTPLSPTDTLTPTLLVPPLPSPTDTPTATIDSTLSSPTDTLTPTLIVSPIAPLTITLLSVDDQLSPSMAITFSADDGVPNRNTTITMIATTADNVVVTKVEFRRNNILQCTDTTAPFECSWTVPASGAASYILEVTAYDPTGNTSTYNVYFSPSIDLRGVR